MSVTLIRFNEVQKRTGFSKAWIYRLMKNNEFPKQVKIGVRAVGWIESEINDFIDKKIHESRGYK